MLPRCGVILTGCWHAAMIKGQTLVVSRRTLLAALLGTIVLGLAWSSMRTAPSKRVAPAAPAATATHTEPVALSKPCEQPILDESALRRAFDRIRELEAELAATRADPSVASGAGAAAAAPRVPDPAPAPVATLTAPAPAAAPAKPSPQEEQQSRPRFSSMECVGGEVCRAFIRARSAAIISSHRFNSVGALRCQTGLL